MKPLHSNITKLSRCACCHSKFGLKGKKNKRFGKKASRAATKKQIKKQITE